MRHAPILWLVALATFFAQPVLAADWPTRPIRIIVPYSAGGAVDILTRLIAAGMSQSLGQSVLVEPRPGGEGNIAAMAVINAPPDGYTLLSSSSVLTVNPLMADNLSWKPEDFAPIGRFATSSGFLVSSATLSPKTLPEVVNYARSHPGLAAATVMGAAHTTFTTKLLAKQAGIEIVTVPYQGAAQHMPDLWEGRVALSTISGNLACSALTDPKLRVLAMTGAKRSAIAPDVPTTAEVGFADVNTGGWYGLHARAGTPEAVITKISEALRKALETDEVKNGLVKACVDIGYQDAKEFGAYVKTDAERWRRVVADVNNR
jgi:tripartite-type tricarboxylate transporter receptor subunit TctC